MLWLVVDGLLCCFVIVLVVLLGVAFFTLLERKILGYGQVRKGPNKVGFVGLLQPISDAMKLFTKEYSMPYISNWVFFLASPVMALSFSLLLWMIYPLKWYWFDFEYGLLFFFCVSSFGVYFVVGSGWFSNSKYAVLGSYRAVAQMISYEVGMILIILCLVIYESVYVVNVNVGELFWYGCGYFFLLIMWLVCCLAETNRSPLDFAEAESELVSGFNVEYGAGGFALIFMSEYGVIMAMSMITMIYFFGGYYVMYFFLIVYFLWVRVSLPRLLYDKLMMLVWKVYLPCSLNVLIFVMSFSFMNY
uniref:NADH-ubiquinone oxidoreductase chain 1 n=1 Tax=Ricinoides karschii TaxID=1238228 RepID=W5R4P2_9ARAC|nr:NADH dehydrogenase subunit 1 [Ricinoides karschii]AGL11957.1 NADH dehydrogenase subunit 1 [Ricinoides karschii]